ncbi:MAG: 2,4-dienoyl-CoA reductase-like NADH-dependent reductase (Old Yellow Enzyme family) [Parasphingorhabdus sp.]|jgi:2,4-dienoyl-CoA reductase-like NADH-dependent reductase (Old Yellow Enzyme family)/thioredoxin reductase
MSTMFPHLFSATNIGTVTIPNRIVSTGHHTYLANEHPSEELIAYHEARAKGGAGLIVTEIIAIHETAMFSGQLLMALSKDCIPHYRELADRIHPHGTKLFAQLFHQGRELLSSTSGLIPPAYAPSAVPNERFHIMPQPMPEALIEDVIKGYGQAAGYLQEAGYDGVEIVANQGYLPAQFLNPLVNLREDSYGGDYDKRLNFVRQVILSIRALAPALAIGLRISGDEMDEQGLSADLVSKICSSLANELDYFSIVAGTSASLGGSVHIVPPMGLESGYTAPYAEKIRDVTGKPTIVTGHINQPQTAENILASGQADLCGMTRALIADCDMPNKASAGKPDDIRACIACNQSCIGRAHRGLGISCIQNPVSGRETTHARLVMTNAAKQVIVIGAGPAGMKAAVMAAQRGHKVTLYEAQQHLGGQALLAQKLPGREEFGGLITNLENELINAGVHIIKSTAINAEAIFAHKPDAVIVATGATPYMPEFEGRDAGHVVNAWQVLNDEVKVGDSVVIADWRADWTGIGLAERLALAGCSVTLCTNAAMAGETLQLYTRNHYVGRLHKLGVSIRTHARFYGVDNDTAYFQDTLTQDPIVLNNIDTVVLSLGHSSVNNPGQLLHNAPFSVKLIGDCVSPRTAEEAVYEGFMAGSEV